MKVKVEKEWQKLASLLNRENDDLPSDALDVLDEEKKKIFKIIEKKVCGRSYIIRCLRIKGSKQGSIKIYICFCL